MLKAEAEWCPSTFSTQHRDTRITLGGKGCIDLQLVCDHSRGPVHSSCAPVVANPAWRLVWALESMKGEDDRIAVEGFYDGVKGPEPGDRKLLEKLAATGEEEKMKRQWGVKGFMKGLHGADLIEAYMFQPTLTINGLQSGYVGPAAYTINPPWAKANMDIRLVPGMDADDVWNKVEAHLKRHGFTDVELKLNGWKANAHRSPSDTRIVAALQGSYQGPRLQRATHLPDERRHGAEHVLHGPTAQDGLRLLGQRRDATSLRPRAERVDRRRGVHHYGKDVRRLPLGIRQHLTEQAILQPRKYFNTLNTNSL